MNSSRVNSKSIYQVLKFSLLSVAMLGLLGACAGGPPPPEVISVHIRATGDVNPDMQGRPSPIILHVMELKSTEQFNRLDYMSLTQPSGAAMGAELVNKNQMVFQPGESKSVPIELNPQTTAIGIVAGYRDIDNAAWRKVIPVTQGVTMGINIILEQTQIVSTATN